MITYSDIRQLKEIADRGANHFLSVYLNVDQSQASNLNRGFITALEDQFKLIGEEIANASAKPRFQAECARVSSFMREYTPHGKSVVIFSDMEKDFWWQRELPVAIQTEVRWARAPYLRPLMAVLEQHERFAVALVDKQRARLFSVYLGAIEELGEIISEVPVKTGGGGWSQTHFQRNHEEHVHWHAKRVAQRLAELDGKLHFERLVIAGPPEATNELQTVLPKSLEQKVAAVSSLSINALSDRVLAKVLEIEEEVKKREELRRVQSLITASHKGDGAITGLNATLSAFKEGRIHQLFYTFDFKPVGSRCTNCGALLAEFPERCFYCGGAVEFTSDLINRLAQGVVDQGGKVCQVRYDGAELLSRSGHIGALLRF